MNVWNILYAGCKRKGTRREFLKQVAWATCAAGLTPGLLPQVSLGQDDGGLPRRSLGKTGEQVSILGLGGWHLGSIKDDQAAVRMVRTAIDQGLTFMDNAWEYHRGRSEEIMGRALRDGYRQKVFLMTKHHGRDKETAQKHLEDSLRRLQTEVIDLWQFHEVIYEDDPKLIFAPGGGIEAAVAAKQSGKVRYIGFTGHKDPKIFVEMLQQDFPWDAVQMPVNVMDSHFRSFQKEILPVLRRRGIGVIAMKSLGGGYLLEPGLVSPKEALEYVWSQPVDTIVSGIDSQDRLQTNIALARAFTPCPSKPRKTSWPAPGPQPCKANMSSIRQAASSTAGWDVNSMASADSSIHTTTCQKALKDGKLLNGSPKGRHQLP